MSGSTDAPNTPSLQLQAFLRWADAMTVKQDPVALAASVTEDFQYQSLPKSTGLPARDKASFVEYASSLMAMMSDFKSDIHEVIETDDTITVHASGQATSITGALYANEYIIIVHVAKQADGEYKLSSMKEFVDSKGMTEFMAAETKRQQERAAQAAA
ncbi:hypothetical protein EIP91_004677 [Steccherinum ochraceum]|uniref:SnoaL-like domain-containing protein n=1 Tax=Steccherinum ochraceum TaxID=92696 RepID=A0A4R0RGR2_9APHY|nr:hypothetical protein EIP91_004677 [Steccherinum ochraceum]